MNRAKAKLFFIVENQFVWSEDIRKASVGCMDPAIPILGISKKKSRTWRDNCTLTCTVVLFTIVMIRKQPQHTLMGEQIERKGGVYIKWGIIQP